ncbi:hypothetical protein A5642_23970 [Mycolicibacterium mucogenicum]|uniref:Carbohydrate kinase PfkB domain-containing protein n=1 Tax=Mycolicibacterium mucogenicum TaxID=56689 RepID=A0A1A0MLB6_MYCMU|nr:PfkB family carbohydrate kinase [Mycolicibacterium mucogenicum]OBA85563.1 hypothetical protein A5642_23970 [Mycolicibacterium mucogenicum]
MIIVGGTYEEIVVVPESHDVAGSGLRAAASLANRDEVPRFHTVLNEDLREEAELVCEALRVNLAGTAERTEGIGFRYITPISAPSVNGPNSRIAGQLVVNESADTALVFGLVEASTRDVRVSARTVVYDPQRPRDAEPLDDLDGFDAERVVIVANSSEIQKLGGRADLREAAQRLLAEEPRICGVVTKRGAAGSLVSERSGAEVTHATVGAHPTRRVWPIGSGDVFSAGLAHAMDSGSELLEAARLGSAATAHWCSTRDPATPRSILDGHYEGVPRPIEPSTPKIYLAGPFFSLAERWLIETVRQELHSLGATTWSPVHEVGHGGLEVAQKDLDGLVECDVVLALLDHADPGTVFEVGWAVRANIPVVGYAQVLDPEGAKMLVGTEVEMHTDLSTACYRAAWAGMGLVPQPAWLT